MESSALFVAVASDDRLPPVIADSLSECAAKAVKEFDLRHSLSDPSNWQAKEGFMGSVNPDPKSWRAKARAHKWGYASIHKIEDYNDD